MPDDAPIHPAHVPWVTHREREVFARPPFLSVVEQSIETGEGRRVDDFYQVRLRDFGLVVPVLEDGRVMMIRQYKHGPGCVSLGFPAGFLDPGEAPEVGALREMHEETGLEAGTVRSLGSYVDNGNQRGSKGHYFLAQGCRAVGAPAPGDLEAFELVTLTPAEIDRALAEGGFAIIHHVAAWGMARALLG